MAETIDYIHLAPREGSVYQQYFVKGRSLQPRRSSALPLGRTMTPTRSPKITT